MNPVMTSIGQQLARKSSMNLSEVITMYQGLARSHSQERGPQVVANAREEIGWCSGNNEDRRARVSDVKWEDHNHFQTKN